MFSKRQWLTMIAIVSLVILIPMLIVPPGGRAIALAADGDSAQPPRALALADELSEAFEHVAETIAPSVVVVRSVREVEMPSFNLPPQFRRFFGPDSPFTIPEPGDSRSTPRLQMGQGSGFIVSEDGFILTNNHVVENATEVSVILHDDTSLAARVVGVDPQTDVAVVKVDHDEYLTPVQFGDSDKLKVGQWVIAAGNPFGLTSSITAGIVSATGRTRLGLTDYEDYIQTDAAINQGNSGGPLVNLRGEVIGVNSAIFSPTGMNLGVGFAIPIKLARQVMDELIDEGRVIRGWLGVYIQDMNEGLAESFDYEDTNGALISEVTPDGPAERAGLKPGDIMTRFDGKEVTDIDQLKMMVAQVAPGSEVEVNVFRNGKSRTIDVQIDELPVEVGRLASPETDHLDLGMTYQTLTPGVAGRLGVDDTLQGIVVTRIQPFGPAARAGISQGDVITHVQQTPVATVNRFREVLRDYDLASGVRLTIRRGDSRRFIFVQIRE